MSKHILVISGSPRKGGNTDTLSDEFIRGAEEAGHRTEKICVREKNIKGCLGCGACRKNGGTCIQKDDMQEVYEKMTEAEILVLAAPVYFYTFNAQMKAVLDRTFALHGALGDKTVYLLSAGQAPEEKYMAVMIDSFRKYIGCFPNMKEGGIVFGYGTSGVGTIEGNPALEQAFVMGKNV